MANTSISGLASGLDTATIIDQLMQIEGQTQVNLKGRLTTQQSTLSTLQTLNTKVAALTAQAKDLADPASWSPLKATSSSTAVSVSAGTGTSAGSFAVTVTKVAAAQRSTFQTTALGGDHVSGAGNDVTLTVAGTATTLTTDGTLSGLVTALNSGATGVRASTIRLDDGTQRLIVQSTATGAANGFTLTASDGSDILGGAVVAAASDAEITIGQDTLHSPGNTFSDVLSGVSLTVSAAAIGTTVSVDVSSDASAVQTKVKSLVDGVNATLKLIDGLSNPGGTTSAAGPLAGDTTIAALRTALLSSVYPANGTSLASMGLQTDRTGQLTLDTSKLAAAYAKDPGSVAAAFGAGTTDVPGFAQRVQAVADRASNAYTGTLSAAVTGRTTSIKQLQDDIRGWDDRLVLRRNTLTQQFTALETALGQMKSQSAWLAGQISSLSSGS